MRLATPIALLGPLFGVLLGLGGCSGGCRSGTPYVPFLEDAGTKAQTDGAVAAVDAALDGAKPPSFQPVHATLAPPNTTKWSLDGLAFEAPTGSLIIAAIARDLDGDGQRDVAAYVQPAAGGGGELRLHRGDDKGALQPSRAVTGSSGSADVALPSPCLGKPTMALVGPHTIALELRPACGDAAPAPRRFLLAGFAPVPSIRWSARIAEPPAGWQFSVDADAPDRDGDGVDDPTLSFALEGGGPPYEPGDRIVARLRYWDRPAGLSRDRTEPEASFQVVSQHASARAGKKATAIIVPALVRRLRLLHAALCAEAGSPWIDIGGDRGVGCGASRGMEDAGAAEVKASLTLGDVLSAIVARERLSSGIAQKTTKTRNDIDKQILAALPVQWATSKDLRSSPSTKSTGAPTWGALAFEKTGTLLIRTATGVIRVDPLTLDDGEANDVPTWGWEVNFPGKDARFSAVVDACDAPYLAARISGHDVPTGATMLPLPILPRFGPSRCSDGKSSSGAQTTPVAWGASGLYTLVDDEPVIVPGELVTETGGRATGTTPAPAMHVEGPFVLGAPRSPSGQYLVVPTRFGLVRRDDSGGAPIHLLIRAKDLEGLYTSLRECAVSNDGTKLACVRDGLVSGKVTLFDTSQTANGTASTTDGGADGSSSGSASGNDDGG